AFPKRRAATNRRFPNGTVPPARITSLTDQTKSAPFLRLYLISILNRHDRRGNRSIQVVADTDQHTIDPDFYSIRPRDDLFLSVAENPKKFAFSRQHDGRDAPPFRINDDVGNIT